jgi:hypothetical protein
MRETRQHECAHFEYLLCCCCWYHLLVHTHTTERLSAVQPEFADVRPVWPAVCLLYRGEEAQLAVLRFFCCHRQVTIIYNGTDNTTKMNQQ